MGFDRPLPCPSPMGEGVVVPNFLNMKKQFTEQTEVNEAMNLSSYAYIEYKAIRFREVGYEAYTNDDAFKEPGVKLPAEVILMLKSGCEQIRDKKGLEMDQPFEGLGIEGFYRLMRMFHFIPIQQQTSLIAEDFIIDRITFQHRVSGDKQRIVLFNKVIKQGNESRE